MKITEVVAALIWDQDRFLICQRPAHKARGLLWEFVGGKVEPGETGEQALVRECQEELGITISVSDVFMEVLHEYPDITVRLVLFHAAIAEGIPQKLEHNDIRWITPAQIPEFDFCPADRDILRRLMAEYCADLVRKATAEDVDTVTGLALQLWPNHDDGELKSKMLELLCREDSAVFLAMEKNKAVGFAQCQLRRDYVEGTSSSPVGYLEGIYVAEDSRGHGLATKLLHACELWAKAQGCAEFASDCELTNSQSLQFHLRTGFQEAGRIICFTKHL